MLVINIFTLTRLNESNLYTYYEEALSISKDKIKVSKEDIELIKEIVINLRDNDSKPEIIDNWFYSFEIP